MVVKPDTLVLSSGSDKGMAEVGVLDKLQASGHLSEVHTIVGCSVGAIIGYLLAIGYTPYEIMLIGLSLRLFKGEAQLSRMMSDYGVCEHSTITDKLTRLSLLKLRKLPTLQELWDERKIKLIAPTVNIDSDTPYVVYLSHENHPNMLGIEAVKRSMSIQPLFPPVIDETGTFVDGALIDPFPINLLDDGQHNILGVNVEVIGGAAQNFIEHISLITSVLVDQIKQLRLQTISDRVKVITVRLKNAMLSDDPNERLNMYCQGYITASRFCEEEPDALPASLKSKLD